MNRNPTRVLLTYPNDVDIIHVIDHLTTLGKSYAAPKIDIEVVEDDEAHQAIEQRLLARGIQVNKKLAEEDLSRFRDNYDVDPTHSEPVTRPSLQGDASLAEEAAEYHENVAVTEEERLPPATPTVGREDRAEKADTSEPEEAAFAGFTANSADVAADLAETEAAHQKLT